MRPLSTSSRPLGAPTWPGSSELSSGDGFMPIAEIHVRDSRHTADTVVPTVFYLWQNQTIKVGRDPDNNDFVIDDAQVSRNHLEFYSIDFEEESNVHPLIYVRDRQSQNGTHVNGGLVGRGHGLSTARVLQNADVVQIRPHLSFQLVQYRSEGPCIGLSEAQQREVKVIGGRFTISNQMIGQGAYSSVYLARDRQSGQQLVCKVTDLTKCHQRKTTLRRCLAEAEIMSQLDHPNVLHFHNGYVANDTVYTFTELLTGGDLFSLLVRREGLQELETRWVVRQVLLALLYLHSKGVAHRDIKPENILCAISPNVGPYVVVSDLGLSGLLPSTKARLKSDVGTAVYQAPECRLGSSGYDLSVDIWSLGMVALQCLFVDDSIGPAPPNQESVDYFLNNTFSTHADKVSCSANAYAFIRSCLSYDPAGRPTAQQALRHAWLCEPREDLELFKRRQKQFAACRRPRSVNVPVIQYIDCGDNGNRTGVQAEAASDPNMDGTVSTHFS